MMNLITIALVLLLSIVVVKSDDPCRFEYPGKGVIDITTVGHSDGTAAFANQIQTNVTSQYMYSYNPCKPFTSIGQCQNVAACQSTLDERTGYDIAHQETASWSPGNVDDDVPRITFSSGDRTVIVKMECSTNGSVKFEVEGEYPPLTYTFRMTHKCACWNGCSSTTPITTTIAPTTPTPAYSACRFEQPGKGAIDFSFIGRTDEKAAYTDELTRTTSNFKYSYNPCRSFSQGSGCVGASVCQVSNDGQQTLTLGTQESAWWDAGSNNANSLPSVNYVYADKKVSVLLQCSTEGNNEFQAFGEDPVNTFKFQLTHKCACWNGC